MGELSKIQHFALVNKISTGAALKRQAQAYAVFVRLSDVLSSPLLLMCLRGCAELENHLGIAEKSLAEFIIDLAKDKTSVNHFQQVRRRPSLSSPPSTGMYLSHVFCQYSSRAAVMCGVPTGLGQGRWQAPNPTGGNTMDHHTAHEGKLGLFCPYI